MSSRSIDITQINANGQNGKTLRVQSNAITFVDLYAANVIESGNTTTGNVFFTNTRAIGALTAGQNITIAANGLITGAAQPFSGNTTNVPEGANLYFTNARVWAAISGNIDNLNNNLNNNLANLTTSNIAEGSNLYFTNARVYSNVLGLLLANNIVETGNTTSGNVYFTNARAVGAFTGGTGITIAANGLIVGTSAFSGNTNLVPEGSANLYYTNARTYANVIELLPNYTGNLKAGNANILSTLYSGNIVTSGSTGGSITGANLIQTTYLVANTLTINGNEVVSGTSGESNILATRITANIWNNLFASNVVENGNTTSGNVFFTNARAIAALTGGSGISIAANGLIVGTGSYSNADAYANLVAALPNYTGNLKAGNANILNQLTVGGNIVTTGSTGGTISGANLISTTYLVTNTLTVNGVEIVSGTSGETNVIATRITANIWNSLYTPNVVELGNTTSGNVYFTNARAVGALTAGQNITIAANGLITGASQAFSGNTTNVPEGANLYYTNARVISIVSSNISTSNIAEGSNLYYTNARAYANLISALPNYTGNLNASFLTVSNTLTAGNVVSGTGTGGSLTGANVISTNYANVYNILVGNVIVANTWTNLFASNVIESGNTLTGNVFFTNARAVAALTGGTGITIASNGLITGSAVSTYADSNVYANLIAALPNYTGNLKAGNANILNTLYAGNIISATGIGGQITGANLISSNIINANTIITGNGTGGNITGANLIITTYMRANVWEGLYTTNVIEGANLYFTNTRTIAALTAGQNISIASNGLITGVSQAFTGNTTSVPEGANLYYTNARVYTAVVGNLLLKANVTDLNTSNVVEGSNLYFTNARVYSNVLGLLLANNIVETGNTLTGNVYFTNARAVAALTGGQNITIASNGLITGASQAFTGNTNLVPEGSANLYYTNARVYANVIDLLPNYTGNLKVGNANVLGTLTLTGNIVAAATGNGYLTGANLIQTTYIRANIWEGLYTSNVVEGSNLYYTNARVYANVIGLLAANNIVETGNTLTGNVFFTNARVVGALTGGTGITIAANGRITSTATASAETISPFLLMGA